MRCVICNAELKPVKEFGEHPKGKFKGEKTVVLRCEQDKHRVTVYVVQKTDEHGNDVSTREIEVRGSGGSRRSRAQQLLERAEALA
jgi:hypothetical protein